MKITRKMLNLLSELLKDAKKSDRKIAKTLKRSQATVTRMRKKLEDKGYIVNYTAVLDISKLGFQIIAFTFFRLKKFAKKKSRDSIHNTIKQDSKVIYIAEGRGLNDKDHLVVSAHKSFIDYMNFLENLKRKLYGKLSNVDFFLTSTKILPSNPSSLGGLIELIKDSNKEIILRF